MKTKEQMTDMQKHILAHFRNSRFDVSKRLDDQISLYNLSCLVGMIETGEATFDDMQAVGGDVLVARIAKTAVINEG